ncbi:MAG: nitroreductase family protein [Chloroflexi bacterium]|nr:nitroreductase family protein [Chloroflexota bacterium]
MCSLKDSSKELQEGPFSNRIRIKIVSAQDNDGQQIRGLGTYGFIKNPTGFIIGSTGDAPGSLEDFGYLFEQLILRVTDLGLGSCWLGGTFTKSRFAQLMDLRENEVIPSVISIGYPADQQAWVDRIARIYAGADRRLPWQQIFFSDTFDHPLDQADAGSYQETLEVVRLAPSASNKQPWRILKSGQQWHFYLQRTNNYPPPVFSSLLKLADLQRIDLGIAMAHFELSAREEQLSGEWNINDPGIPLPDTKIEYISSWIPG